MRQLIRFVLVGVIAVGGCGSDNGAGGRDGSGGADAGASAGDAGSSGQSGVTGSGIAGRGGAGAGGADGTNGGTCGPGVWREGPQLSDPREQAAAVLLPSGQVLVVGGHPVDPRFTALSSAELYDPATDVWTPTGSLNVERSSTWLGTCLLEGGMVLTSDQDYPARSPSELYDPALGSWSVTGKMSALANGSLVALPGGNALAAGGIDWPNDAPIAFAQVYRGDDGTWVEAAPLLSPRWGHAALVVGDNVLVVGGSAVYPSSDSLATAELYDPSEDRWREAAAMSHGRWGPRAVLLEDGRVLVAGGNRGNHFETERFTTAELYDPVTDTWTTTGSMLEARAMCSLTRLADGRVLAAGGYDGYNLSSAEVYDPAKGTWSAAGSMAGERRLHTAVLLPSGDVLVVGGYANTQLFATEIYTPCGS
jgi:N-acetylneuraminic acid mutarotase